MKRWIFIIGVLAVVAFFLASGCAHVSEVTYPDESMVSAGPKKIRLLPDYVVPDGLTVEGLGHLNRLGGTVTNIHQEEKGRTRIEESMPAANVAIFKTWLAGFTDGQGHISEP